MIENDDSEQIDRLNSTIVELLRERDALRDFARWVDSWVSNPVTAYSVHALDGLFGVTRDKITALPRPASNSEEK